MPEIKCKAELQIESTKKNYKIQAWKRADNFIF